MTKFLTISPTGAPGKKEYAWNKFRLGNYVAIGWLHDYNLIKKSMEDIIKLIREQNYDNEASAIDSFKKFLALDVGDLVAINNVNHGLFGIGEIKSCYKYKMDMHDPGYEDGHGYSHYRVVNWRYTNYLRRKDILGPNEKGWVPYGTVGDLLEEVPPYILRILGESPESQKGPTYIIPDFLKNVINEIKVLMSDPTHQERAHESLVVDFLVNLGYEKHQDIKFRQGRMDISINIFGKILMVFEVKKDWNLNMYSHSNAIQQAYRYALDHGIRYVILTNGDYYAIFDRLKGLSISSNLIGEFKLTSLEEEDINLINKISKNNLLSPSIEEIFINLSEIFKDEK